MAQHSTYWSCTKFANWLRGTPKPNAATGKGWDDWETESKQAHPFRHWLAEEALGEIQDFVTWPNRKLHDIKYYINNRWITRSHALTAHPSNINPGSWCDVGNRFLPCLFNELVDFVEVEQAWHHVLWNEEAQVKYAVPWYRRGWLRLRTWRCPEAGIAHLSWASELRTDDNSEYTYQAKAAQEILTLYHWWKDVYPNRPDPHDASGWSEWCEIRREKNGGNLFRDDNDTMADRDKTREILDKSNLLEEEQKQEDEDMMIRLIRVRDSLWT
jgi:hypothetical protein